jgi:hypothetical protein
MKRGAATLCMTFVAAWAGAVRFSLACRLAVMVVRLAAGLQSPQCQITIAGLQLNSGAGCFVDGCGFLAFF